MKRLGRDVIAVRELVSARRRFLHSSLILRDGECWRLGQGLQVVDAYRFKAPTRKFRG